MSKGQLSLPNYSSRRDTLCRQVITPPLALEPNRYWNGAKRKGCQLHTHQQQQFHLRNSGYFCSSFIWGYIQYVSLDGIEWQANWRMMYWKEFERKRPWSDRWITPIFFYWKGREKPRKTRSEYLPPPAQDNAVCTTQELTQQESSFVSSVHRCQEKHWPRFTVVTIRTTCFNLYAPCCQQNLFRPWVPYESRRKATVSPDMIN